MEFETYLSDRRAVVEAHLNASLPAADQYPPRIHEAIRYAAIGGGKRLRPILVLATGEMLGGNPTSLLDAAVALELIHVSTLILDDLPSMDDATLRHGRPAVHRQYDEAVAILAAVALLVHAYDLVARNGDRLRLARARLAEVVHQMSRATGSVGLVGGQVKDLEMVGKAMDLRTLEFIHSRKTGQLFVLAATVGPLLLAADEADVSALASYAKNLGLAYQIVDDLLDREGTVATLGKDVGKDAERSTFASLVSPEEARRLVAELVETAKGWVRPFGRKAGFLLQFADMVGRRRA